MRPGFIPSSLLFGLYTEELVARVRKEGFRDPGRGVCIEYYVVCR